jgi:3-methyl-2-oxobutanoate hydroxymethyltransferase
LPSRIALVAFQLRSEASPVSRQKAESIKAMKGHDKIPVLTAYDFAMTKILDELEIPVLLVGDSLGMVVLGYEDTTQVTLSEMQHHVRAVARACPRGLIVADLPFHSYETPAQAVESSRQLLAAGAQAMKAEGGRSILPQVHAIIAADIPFLGHLGMLPQHVREEGGYHVKGKTDAEKTSLIEDALALAETGAFGIVLELVTPRVAKEITDAISIPTIGIGSGHDCDGQVIVTTDLWGTTPGFIPRHVKPRLQIAEEMKIAIREWRKRL